MIVNFQEATKAPTRNAVLENREFTLCHPVHTDKEVHPDESWVDGFLVTPLSCGQWAVVGEGDVLAAFNGEILFFGYDGPQTRHMRGTINKAVAGTGVSITPRWYVSVAGREHAYLSGMAINVNTGSVVESQYGVKPADVSKRTNEVERIRRRAEFYVSHVLSLLRGDAIAPPDAQVRYAPQSAGELLEHVDEMYFASALADEAEESVGQGTNQAVALKRYVMASLGLSVPV